MRRWLALTAIGLIGIGPALAAPADPVRVDRDTAFARVLTDYPSRGRAGLLEDVKACYGQAATPEASRSCYMLDLTTRMIDAHVVTVRNRSVIPASDVSEADVIALGHLIKAGVNPDAAKGLVAAWGGCAREDATIEQKREVFAMLHEG